MERPGLDAADGASDPIPLCLALDGALLRTHTTAESLVVLARRRPASLLAAPLWRLRGRARFRRRLSSRAPLDPAALPYDPDVVAWAREEHRRGRTVWLTTAADLSVASAVAAHLGFFDGVVASAGEVELAGPSMARALIERVPGGFDYASAGARAGAGDGPVRASARQAILVGVASSGGRAERGANVLCKFPRPRSGLRVRLRALRVHQWAKNLLVFLPLIGAHRVRDVMELSQAILAFLAFGVVASGVYVLNDILDVSSDRLHLRKRHRPIASGELSIGMGALLVPLLLVLGAVLASPLPRGFGAILAAYFLVTLAYSLGLKRRPVLDVLTLAALYTSRIFAGGLATGIPVSEWLATFSMFLFLSLAFLKRSTELVDSGALPGRGYVAADRQSVLAMGSAAGYLSVLVLALYISAPEVRRLYPHPQALWALCPLVLFWVTRLWFLAQRGEVDDDPLVFAFKDRTTYVVALAGAVAVYVAARA